MESTTSPANENSPSQSGRSLSHETWEIEILISGGAFFSLYQLSGSLVALMTKLNLNFYAIMVVSPIAGAIRILSIYFAAHLCMRALWLSLVLLRKVHPAGINITNLRFSEPYRSTAEKYNLTEQIARLDRWSGLIFSWAVIFTITLIGMGLATSIFVLPLVLLKVDPGVTNTLKLAAGMVLALSFDLFLFDLFTYGLLRRTRALAKLFYPVYLFWNTITLGFIWRPGLQLIYSNVKSKWRASLVAALLTLGAILVGGDEDDFMKLLGTKENTIEMEVVTVDEIKYMNRRTSEESRGPFIQSEVITDNHLSIFVNLKMTDVDSLDSLPPQARSFSRLVVVAINDSVCTVPAWIGIRRKNGEEGIQTVLDISSLQKKMHVLRIGRTYDSIATVIPFWKL